MLKKMLYPVYRSHGTYLRAVSALPAQFRIYGIRDAVGPYAVRGTYIEAFAAARARACHGKLIIFIILYYVNFIVFHHAKILLLPCPFVKYNICMFNGLHYNSISAYLKERFGCRVVKLALDGGFTCPNRDGTKGLGGCTFCSDSGSGDFAGTIEQQLASVSRKWNRSESSLSAGAADKEAPDLKYIAYFQSHTNTYASPERLRALWDEALAHENVVGLAIATRPDCLGPEVLDLLEEYNEKTFLWVELGLQTSSDDTAGKFNRCSKTAEFTDAAYHLSSLEIKCVIHLILGLPGEDKAQFRRTAEYVRSLSPFGIKIHMLHLMEGTAMGEEYRRAPFPLLTMEEYVSCVCDILEMLPQSVTVHRLTGDAPQDKLIAPEWTRNKHAVLNAIQQEFKRRGSFQGCRV